MKKACEDLREQLRSTGDKEVEKLIKEFGYRYKFPAKAADLRTRWCSSQLKISVADSVIAALDAMDSVGGSRLLFPAKGTTHQGRWCSGTLKASVQDAVTSNAMSENTRILVVSGERRGESTGRSRYNEIEKHRTNAEKKAHRMVHQWRAVIDWSEKDVWEIIKRHHINPHPCYRAGWNRCSCCCCVFSSPRHLKGISEILPDVFEALKEDERELDFTFDAKCNLDDYIKDAESCLPPACMKYGFVQLGEPSAHKTNPRTGKIAAVYATFQQVAEGVWKYCGKCFIGEKVQVAL